MTKKKDQFSNFSATISLDGQERSLTYKSKGITGGMQIFISAVNGAKLQHAISVICDAKIDGRNIIIVESYNNPRVFKLEF